MQMHGMHASYSTVELRAAKLRPCSHVPLARRSEVPSQPRRSQALADSSLRCIMQPAWQSSCAETWLPKSMGVAVQELERGTISMLMQQLVTPLAGALEDQLRARAASTCLPGALEYLSRARPQAVTAGLISGRSASSPRKRDEHEGSTRG